MKILSIVPARGGSKGIPLKNIIRLNKKPLLYYTVKASLNSKLINRTIVSTDNKKIARVAKRLGAEVVKRPKRLANDYVSLEPVILHTLNFLKNSECYVPDVIVTLQNTSPLRTAKHIDQAIRIFRKENFDSLLSGCLFHSFLWQIQDNNTIKLINYNPKKRPDRRQDMIKQIHENGAIYVTKYSFFRRTNYRKGGQIGYYKMPIELSYEIDTPHDLFIVEQIMKNKKIYD